MITRNNCYSAALVAGALLAGLLAPPCCARADYPPYTAASPPSDQFRITDSPAGATAARPAQTVSPVESLPPAQSSSAYQSLPPEVPWGQSRSAPNGTVLMGQNSTPYLAHDSPEASTIISPAPAAVAEQLIESSVYTRIDYFHWNERIFGKDFVNEDGVLVTLGYVHQFGVQRVRAEVFGSQVNYGAPYTDLDGTADFLSSKTDYLGVRAEYELLYDPEVFPGITLFAGLGTRFWYRNLPDDFSVREGEFVSGYEETWWTIYPYIGLETKRTVQKDVELYGMARIGVTAVTHEDATINWVALWPQPGVTGQLEGGIRGPHRFLGAFFEGMSWNQSGPGGGAMQPTSTMYTVGLKTGFLF